MTKINRMVMKGFKSFGNRVEMIFGEKYNVVLGPNGAGKCVDGETLVQLADGSIVKIRDLVNKNMKKPHKMDDACFSINGNAEVLCLDTKTLKVVPKQVQSFVKRKTPEKMLKITTRRGKEIIATEYHPLFTLKDGKIEVIRAEELKEGIRIATPRKIEVKRNNPYFTELIDLIKEDDNIYVPYDERFVEILKNIKKKTWKETADKIRIPLNSLKGLFDKQSINFAYLVRIFRYVKLEDMEIINLIKNIKSKNYPLTYNMLWKNSPEFSRFFGYLLAEGRVTDNQIWFTNGDENIIEDYKNLIENIFQLKSSVKEYKPNCWDVLAYPTPIIKILRKFGLKENTEKKEIKNIFLKHSSKKELCELLNGLYSGDGYVGNHSIEITTKSRKLSYAIENILLRLGLNHTTKWIIKAATNSNYSGVYKQISIYGVENLTLFNSLIEFKHKKKMERLSSILNKKANPNIDLIEVNQLVKETSKELNINIKNMKKKFPKIDSYCYNQCTPSINGVREVINELFIPTAKESQVCSLTLAKLSKLVYSDIIWDEIVEIEKINPREEWVYDLCVEGHHNFIANNFFVHNSNIMDALCFVLGKGSAKGLRAEKASNLIYDGGKTKNPAKQGEVHIYFDNATKTFPTEDEEIKVSRIIRQNGQSIYKINDKKRTKQQILDLLGIANINPDAYNIILQGDIIRLVEMSTLQRREIIDDIAGIGVYEEKKIKALRELDKVDQKLNEAEIILTERKTYLKELKRDRDQAMKYKELNDKVSQNKATYLHLQIKDKTKDKDKLDSEIKKYQDEIAKIQGDIDTLKKQTEEKKETVRKLTKEVEQKGEKEQVAMLKKIEIIRVEIATNQTRTSSCKNEISRINTRKDQLLASTEELRSKIKELKKEEEEANRAKQRTESQLKEVETKIAVFKKKNKMEDADDIDKKVEEIDKEADEKQKEILGVREEQQNLLREKDKIEYQISTMDEKIKKVLEVEKEHKAEIEKLKQKQHEFKKVTLELNKILNEDSSLALQLSNGRSRLNSSREELAKLETRNVGIKEAMSANLATANILKQKNLGEIYGMISQLGNVESKFGLALEVAAGPKMRSVVVDSDKTAANCIKFLKKERSGTATFLPLNKIRPAKEDASANNYLKTNGVYGKAIDLISYDSKFRNVFSYVFGNTIVVDNIDTARRIGIGNIRMATLDGDMAEMSGAMHGGFRQKERGLKFQEKEIVSKVKKLEKEVNDGESLVSVLEKRKTENEDNIERFRKLKGELEGDVIKMEKSLHLDSDDLKATRDLKKELDTRIVEIDKQMMTVNMKVSTINKDLASLKMNKQELRDKIMELRNPRLIAELNTFEQKKSQLKEDVIKYEAAIKNVNMQIKNILKPEEENVLKIIKQHDKEEEGFKAEIKELEEKIKEQKNDLIEKEKGQKAFYAEFKELFGKRDKLNENILKLETKIIGNEERVRGTEHRMNAFSIENARVKAELSGLEEDFSRYKDVELFTSKPIEQIKKDINEFERMVQNIGNVNMRALEVYDNVEKEYESLLKKKELLGKEKEEVLVMMNEIEGKKKDMFMKSFDVINANFQKMFSSLSTKGEAFLDIENPDNPLEAGLGIKVRLTGKKFLDIRSLSGGEKTLTALALIFAIQEHEPASFYVFDEVDAALDKRNSEKLSKLVKNYSDRAQYIIISHNDGMITEADTLYGVSMDSQQHISKVVSLKV